MEFSRYILVCLFCVHDFCTESGKVHILFILILATFFFFLPYMSNRYYMKQKF